SRMDGALRPVELEEPDPLVVDELAHLGVLLEHAIDRPTRGFDEHTEPERLVHPALAIVERFEGQADPKIAALALADSQVSADDVVEHLVPAAVARVVDGGRVVLEVDPMRDDQGARHHGFEDRVVRVVPEAIVMEERASFEVEMTAPLARS